MPTIIDRFGTWKKALIAAANAESGAPPTGCGRVVSRRRAIPLAKRFLVIKRDRYRCRICNRSGVELEVDHIVPVSQGGSDRLDNLQTALPGLQSGEERPVAVTAGLHEQNPAGKGGVCEQLQ